MKKNLYAFIAIVGIFCIGCSYNGAPNNGPGKTVPPKAGSFFYFKNVQTDTLGVPIDSTKHFYKDSVAETGTQYSGKTNVTHIISIDTTSGFRSTSDTYINYESNGDISVYTGAGGAFGGISLPNWRTYTFQSQTTSGFLIADTTISIPFQGLQIPVHITAFDTMSFAGEGTYTANSASLSTLNTKEVITENGSAIIASIKTHTTSHLEFAPSLGYIVSQIIDPTIIPAYIPSQGGQQTLLISYVLK